MAALRAQYAPAFRVMACQTWTHPERKFTVIVTGRPLGHDGVWWNACIPGSCGFIQIREADLIAGWVLNETDPATLGTVEHMVRESWATDDRVTDVCLYEDEVCGFTVRVGRDWAPPLPYYAPTRHEAWAAALHAAPTKEV